MRPAGAIGFTARGASQDDRLAFGRAKAGFKADILAVTNQPFRTSLHIGPMLRLRRNAGEAHVLAELIDKLFLIFF
jgi:hypothetical protein